MKDSLSSHRKRKRALGLLIGIFLFAYSLVTITPFYFLVVRSFIPTIESTTFQLWPVRLGEFNMESRVGTMGTYYSVDLQRLKERLGIEGYLPPTLTFTQVSERYDIPPEKITRILTPYVRFNGWFAVLQGGRFLTSMWRTAALTGSSIVVGGFLGAATGSVLARFRRKWHMVIYNTYLVQMIIPPVMIMIPLYIIIVRYLGLGNNYLALFLLYIRGGALSTMLFTGYISTIPSELAESVKIDGGNRFQFFLSIILPLCMVPFASFTVIHIPLFWNDLLNGLLFLRPDRYTLVPLINSFQGQYNTNFQAVYAGLCLMLAPILILYFACQRLFVRSALSGALKG